MEQVTVYSFQVLPLAFVPKKQRLISPQLNQITNFKLTFLQQSPWLSQPLSSQKNPRKGQ